MAASSRSYRNTTCGTPSRSRKASVIPILSTTWLDVNILLSEWRGKLWLGRMIVNSYAGISRTPMSMLTVPSVLRRPLPNMTLTASFTSPRTTLTRALLPNTSLPRSVLLLSHITEVSQLNCLYTGMGRGNCSHHLPRDHHRPSCAYVWIRRQSLSQARQCDQSLYRQPLARALLAGSRKSRKP